MKWIVLALLFVNGIPVNSRIYEMDPEQVKTEADCKAEVAVMQEVAKKRNADVFLKCIEVPERPKFKKENDS
jgi:hypothetical protein